MDYKKIYDKQYWIEEIYEKNKLLTKQDKALIKKAYLFSEMAHKNQKRKSGEPYFIHLVATAKNLAEIGMDGTVIAAGILHDSIEDGVATKKKIKEEFGDEILFLINGVTKLGTIRYHGMQRHNESLRKLFVATSKDIRVLIIKFADRIHNLSTLEYVKPEKQRRIAMESLEIYTQLAYRLGITTLSKALGDLAFPYVYPEEYAKIKKILKERSKENLKNLEQVSRSITKKLVISGIKDFKIKHRVKALLALYKKLQRKDGDPEKIFDLIALRVIVPSITDCYKTLGIIHESFRPMPGRIKDFIAFPKPNGYKSIHTSIFTGQGGMLEIQIRTPQMDMQAEYGAASHLSYKAKTIGVDGVSGNKQDWVSKFVKLFGFKKREDDKESNKIIWIDDLAKKAKESETDNEEFANHLKQDFFSDRIFIFTPEGDVVDLPVDSTSVDFAYQIHTSLGNTITGTKINGNFKALDTKLKNGDVIEIISKKGAIPNIKWLEFVKTTTAQKKIKQVNEKKII